MNHDAESETVRNAALVGVRRISVRGRTVEVGYLNEGTSLCIRADAAEDRSRFAHLCFAEVRLMRHKRLGRFAVVFGEPDNETLEEYEELVRGNREC